MFGSRSKSDSLLMLALLLGTTAAAAAEGVLTRAPELATFVQAPYPAGAEADGITGEVVLLVTIEADGTVSAVEVAQPAGHGFDEAAVEAARQFVFRPAEVDGQPAAVQIAYKYAFTLTKEEVAPALAETGALAGRLLERGTRKPLVGITVRIGEVEGITDAEGRVQLAGLPVGEAVIEVRDPAFVALEDREPIRAGEEVEVTWYLERTGFADGLEAVGRRPAKEVTRRTLTVQEIRTIPGASGDALKVVQNLPGVARVPFGGGALILRGGGNSHASIEGHPLPLAFHFGGLRSTVSSALIESIDLYPGNQGPEFGRGNGGVVDIRLRKPGRDGWHGYGEVDLFDAGAFLEGPVGESGGFALGARRSYVDGVLQLALDDETLKTFAVAPRYYDYQAMYDHDLGRHGVRLLAYGGGDRMVFLLDEPSPGDPAIRGDLQLELDWIGAQADWRWRLSDDVRHRLSASWLYRRERQGIGAEYGIAFDRQQATVRDEVEVVATDWMKVRGGLDLEVDTVAYDVTSPRPPKEGEVQTPLSANETISAEGRQTLWMPALWAEMELRWGDLTVLPGLRADYVTLIDDFAVQPRVTARYRLFEGTTLKAGAGLYSEVPEVDEVNEVFGNPELGLERSIHYSAGVEQRLTEHLSLDLTGFYKDFDDLVTRVDDAAVAYRNQGDGRAYGLEVLLRHEAHARLYGWVAYTLMRSERRDAPGEDYRLFTQDQTHNLTVVANYKLTTTWELGLRWRFVTGNLHTPLSGGTFDSDADTYVAHSEAPNSERLGAFHQLDLRVDKHWIFDAWRLTTYLEVQNAYLRENPEGVTYNFDYTERDTVAGLPLLPSFGVRGEF